MAKIAILLTISAVLVQQCVTGQVPCNTELTKGACIVPIAITLVDTRNVHTRLVNLHLLLFCFVVQIAVKVLMTISVDCCGDW